jgi:hypothetical protein
MILQVQLQGTSHMLWVANFHSKFLLDDVRLRAIRPAQYPLLASFAYLSNRLGKLVIVNQLLSKIPGMRRKQVHPYREVWNER